MNLSFPGCFGEAGACTQVSIHASASLRTRLCTKVLKTFSRLPISSTELKEHLSRTLPASFSAPSRWLPVSGKWNVKNQAGAVFGEGGIRDSHHPSTYSADNLNGTGISFSMVTRDGRRLEKEREDRPGKIWCWRSRESCKLCNFSLLCKLHVEEGKVPSLPAQSPRQAVPQPRWGALSVCSVLMWGEETPYSAPVLPRGKTNASWTLGMRESCRLLPHRKQNLLKAKRYWRSLYSTSCLQIEATDANSACVPALTTNWSRELASSPLPALHLTWK